MTALMVQGTASSAGKSFLATALCRIFARRGHRVAPFKAVNMSNNARVVDAGEMATAQFVQALAAGVEPDVRMAPILVKPESTGSQVVVLGTVDRDLSAMAWGDRPPHQRTVVRSALEWTLENHDIVVIEGAGSPAEINLRSRDVVNMDVAHAADATVLVVTDIDRGGSFAHLYGTWGLLDETDRARLRGFVLNRFRGDPRLLDDGPDRLQELTGVPTVAVVPWIPERLPEEDGFGTDPTGDGLDVAIVAYPSISNLDEFRALGETAAVRTVRELTELGDPDLVVLPGSKDVRADLRWLRSRGLDTAVAREAGRRTPILAICGGLQMVGTGITFEDGISEPGLGLVPTDTTYRPDKLVASSKVHLSGLTGPWRKLDGIAFDGYEIRRGRTIVDGAAGEGAGIVQWGSVLGITAHGLFEHPDTTARLTGRRADPLDEVIDRIADRVEASFDVPVEELLGPSDA